MINIELDAQSAVYVMQSLLDTQNGYTDDESCVPSRIVKIREVISQIDTALENANP